jgi:hypothetical protein
MGSPRKRSLARSLQKLLLLLMGLAFLAPVLYLHHITLPCSPLTPAATNSTLDRFAVSDRASETVTKLKMPATVFASRLLNTSAMCQSLASTSALALWVEHIDQIHAASRLRRDRKYKLHDLTAEVLQLITPRLPLSTRTLSRDTAVVEALLHKAYVRFEHLNAPSKDRPRGPPPQPISIVVLGGSVTAGVNCISGIGGSDIGKCAWPVRLECLINNMAGGEIVRVNVFALGGSNTKTATALLEYDLLPKNAQNPDIIINAYSTNDMHIDTIKEAKGEGKTLTDKVFDMAQDFIRVALRPRPCQAHPPLLLWLDDYLGNEQRVILETTALSSAMHVLANYYGFSSVSYADAVRDWVYGDTREQLFSPDWYKGKAKTFSREIHPGQGMHMATAWIMAYNLLHLATNYCSLEAWNVVNGEATMEYNHSKIPGLPELRRTIQVGSAQEVKPRPTPAGLAPILSDSLNLRSVSQEWQESSAAAIAEEAFSKDRLEQCQKKDYRRCPFSWIVGFPVDGKDVDLYHTSENSENNVKSIHDYFARQVTDFGGWEVIDDTDREKFGWVPVAGSRMTIEFNHLRQPVRTLTFFVMKSYGEKWANSTARIEVSSNQSDSSTSTSEWKMLASKDLFGFHDKETSEMYTEPIELPNGVQTESSLRITITLVAGSTFKIQGLAVCS